MTLAGLLKEIRLRAEPYRGDSQPASAQVALTILTGFGLLPTPEGQVIRKVLTALAHTTTVPAFSEDELATLTPLPLVTLARLTEGMMEGELPDRELQTLLRPFLVRPH